MMGTAVWRQGDHVLALGTSGDSPHPGLLCRFAVADLLAGRVAPEWWDGTAFGNARPVTIMDEAAPECSLHFEPRLGRWLHVCSRGFGASTIAVRNAADPAGPWTGPEDVFTPPESRAGRAMVYAGKAHPEAFAGDNALLVTYAANASDFSGLFTPEGQRTLYWPRAVRLRFGH
jgi:hypothetical protein